MATKGTEVKSDEDIQVLFQETYFVNYVLFVAIRGLPCEGGRLRAPVWQFQANLRVKIQL